MVLLQAAWLAVRERFSASALERLPEPSEGMVEEDSAASFDEQGSSVGALLGVYHFNAEQVHRLAPEGARVLDLGCGSGRFLAYLSERRPDLRILGLDLSKRMIDVGNRRLRGTAVADRVELRTGDMASLEGLSSARFDLVTSVFSLHHLPGRERLRRCLAGVAAIRRECGAGLYVFDHARPRSARTADLFPEIFTRQAPKAFKQDSRNSLRAAWSYAELSVELRTAFSSAVAATLARFLPIYQVHWVPPKDAGGSGDWKRNEQLPPAARRDARRLAPLFRRLPGEKEGRFFGRTEN